jgi:hypothetical protein
MDATVAMPLPGGGRSSRCFGAAGYDGHNRVIPAARDVRLCYILGHGVQRGSASVPARQVAGDLSLPVRSEGIVKDGGQIQVLRNGCLDVGLRLHA